MKLLTLGNTKTIKGEKLGYQTYILHLAPAWLSGYNVCPMASAGCAAACLNTAGRGRFDRTQEARIRKTRMFFEDRTAFMALLAKDIQAAIRKSKRDGFIPVFRLNGTSDIRWENIEVFVENWEPGTRASLYRNLMGMFPTVQFYDYTKIPNRRDLPENYHLTFSRSESNDELIAKVKYNVAVVFAVKKKAELPAEYLGRTVVDGDDTDLRFLDPANVIVGLRSKGDAKKDDSGFVVAV